MDLNAVVSTATDFLKSNSKAISLGLGGALFVWLAGKFAKSRRIRKAHDEKIKKLIEQFKASGEKDLHVASEIRCVFLPWGGVGGEGLIFG